MIQVKNLIYDYPAIRAVDNISITLEKGTITALVGPNGAGKSTLLRCLAGLEKPFSGDIRIDGIDVLKEPRRSHKIVGFLPDFFGLYDDLTVRQSLTFFAAIGGMEEETIPAAVAEAAKRLEIDDKIDSCVKTLSRGMRQRLAIAQIVVKKPRVILLDEPASGLDPGARSALSTLFRQLKAEGMTLIVSSHILTELEQYADRLVIMNRGKVLENTDGDAEMQTTKVAVSLLDGIGEFVAFTEQEPLISAAEADDGRVIITIAGGRVECAKVLVRAIQAGHGIHEYCTVGRDMQSEYLRAVALCKGGTGE